MSELTGEETSGAISEYSPPPWRAEPLNVPSDQTAEDYGSWAVYDSRPNTLPLVLLDHHRDGHPGFRKSVGAHARLIAAAPDLLALAKEYAGSCINCNGFGYTVGDDGVTGCGPDDREPTREHCGECEHIRALIAKAEGRS